MLREVLRYLAAQHRGQAVPETAREAHRAAVRRPERGHPALRGFGIPGGACAIAIYHKRYNNWERVESKLAEAIVGMGRFPDRYQTRYSKLSPKQRWVFRVIGSELAQRVPEGGPTDKMEEACEKVAGEMRDLSINSRTRLSRSRT